MNRQEQLDQLLNTIHHYSVNEPDGNIYNLAIQVASQLGAKQEKEQVVAGLLLSLKHLDND